MKINKIKALVGVLATSAVISLVGSISGTVAWLQYNTRTRAEMHGTTAKCTENLQIRTVVLNNLPAADATVEEIYDTDAELTAAKAGYAEGQKAISLESKKLFTKGSGADFDAGVALVDGNNYQKGEIVYSWNNSESKLERVDANVYGDWKSALTKEDINDAAAASGHALATGDVFMPVTNPGIGKDSALGTFYSHPLCGHEKYETGSHKWKPATAGYLQFGIQFRTLDINGDAGDQTLAQDLYLTDLTVIDTAGPKTVSSALRFHLEDKTTGSKKLLGLGKAENEESITIDTHGNLDLDGDGDLDTVADIPNNYSWTADANNLLDYGATDSQQTYYNVNRAESTKSLFLSEQDEYGALKDVDPEDIKKGVVTTTTVATVGNGAALNQLIIDTADDNKLKVCTAEYDDPNAPVWEVVTPAKGDVYKIDGAMKEYNGSAFVDYTARKGQSLGTTVAGDDVFDADHLTFVVTMWLEGWEEFERDSAELSKGTFTAAGVAPTGVANGTLWYDTSDAEHPVMKINNGDAVTPNWEAHAMAVGDYYYDGTHYHQAVSAAKVDTENADTYLSNMWDELKTVGAAFNIGFSFAIPALEPIQA